MKLQKLHAKRGLEFGPINALPIAMQANHCENAGYPTGSQYCYKNKVSSKDSKTNAIYQIKKKKKTLKTKNARQTQLNLIK